MLVIPTFRISCHTIGDQQTFDDGTVVLSFEKESLCIFPQHSLCVYELGCILSSAYSVPKTHFSFHFAFFYFRRKPCNFYSV